MRHIERKIFSFADGKPVSGFKQITTIPREPLDDDIHLAPVSVTKKAIEIQNEMTTLGFDMLSLREETADIVDVVHAVETVDTIRTAAAVLYGEWQVDRKTKNKIGELATAKLINGLTRSARELDKRFHLFDHSHIEALGREVAAEAATEDLRGSINLQRIADALNHAGDEHTDDKAWPWVVLPTFPKQHYGRILLQQVPGVDERYPAFITQPTFLSGEGTQFHTHGQNWAFARPVGRASEQSNSHINTLWKPTEPVVFPMQQLSKDYYRSNNVVIIPPRAVHAITGVRVDNGPLLSVADLLKSGYNVRAYADAILFSGHSSMHIYRPDMSLARELVNSPLVKRDEKFFMDNDMIVFDHTTQNIWSGGGGAWSRRLIEFGPSGEHCGACFVENDARNENINPQEVLAWYAKPEDASIISFSY